MPIRAQEIDAATFEAYDAHGFGQAIRGLRTSAGWTQATLAEWCGASRQTIVALEQGGPVSMAVAMKAIAVLGGKIVVAPKDAVISRAIMR